MLFLNDGLRWLKFSNMTFNTINAVWGSSATNIFAVGSLGTILTFNGTSWSLLTPSITTLDLFCVWGSSTENVYVGGYTGKLLRYNGLAWKTVSLGTSQTLKSIWGSSASDVYATGSEGTIIHFDGSTWNTVAIPGGVALNALWGSAYNDVFAAGEAGTIYHYDGNVWTKLVPPASLNISAAWGSTSGKVYFACQDGRILIYTRDDHIPPVINYAEIPGNAGTAYISTPVTFYFTEEMSESTLNNSTITLKSGSTILPADINLSGDKMAVAVSGNLAYSTSYTVTIIGGSNGVKDIAGNALTSDYSFSFTTEPKPDSEPGTGNGNSGCFINSARP